MPDFASEIQAVEEATEALEQAVNREFPVGTEVYVKWGNGWMPARVAFECRGRRIAVRTDSGVVHRRDCTDVMRR